MLIGIDGNEANQPNKVGIGQVAFNVLWQLYKIDKKNVYQVFLKSPPLSDLPPERAGWKYEVFGPKKIWTQLALPINLWLKKTKPDVFFSPSHYAPRFSPVPTVIYLMDLWHHRHPEQFNKKDLYQLTKWEEYSVKNAKHILTISQFSKSEILDIYKVPENKVTVAYPGYTKFQIPNSKHQINSKIQNIKQKYNIKGDYFLYLGTLQPKKNIEGLIKAFECLIHNSKFIIQLVIAGKKGWQYDKIFDLVKELKLEDKIVFTGFVSEEEKPFLMAGVKAFVFPSFYEGFGIPVLESFNLGVPVMVANAGSLPEVGGKAAIYCDPDNIKSIASALEKVLSLNAKQRNEIINLGYQQAVKFSWEKCTKQVLETLEKNAIKN